MKQYDAAVWREYSEPQLNVEHYAELAQAPFLSVLRKEFRIAVSQEMKVVERPDTGKADASLLAIMPSNQVRAPAQKSQIVEGPKSSALADTGRRLQLFKSGVEILSNHPWWGIGHKQWAVAMLQITGFPFGSPHNGLLEVWGSYGVLGALLYAALIVVAGRNYLMIERRAHNSISLWLNRGIGLFLFALVLHELVEVATVLAVTPYALWAWMALGLQDGLRRSLKPTGTEAARPVCPEVASN